MKELTITPPKDYEVDKEKSTFEKIIFKSIDSKPRSWEGYCKNFPIGQNEYYLNIESKIIQRCANFTRDLNTDKNLLPSRKYAEAFLAMMQLISLRQAWVGDWIPKYADSDPYYSIIYDHHVIHTSISWSTNHPLSFPTEKIAKEFLHCFKDLCEQAIPLL